MRRFLITGGAGFIGSNFIKYLLSLPEIEGPIVNLDALTYAGNVENLSICRADPRYIFQHGDIRSIETVSTLLKKYNIDTIVHFAAESHVDKSIQNPGCFISTNVMGTQVLLDAARAYWSENDGTTSAGQSYRPGVRFLQVSTDEVYGALGETGIFTELTPLAPNSPYSASKAGADLLTRAYYKTYGLPVNITRCSNNYGPFQHPEKLIPRMISRAMQGKPLPVYGDGQQIRDWLHVSDHCSALFTVLKRGQVGEVYNIGGNCERSNLQLVRLILKQMGCSEDLIQFVADRPGHDRRYAIDNSKISMQLGWRPQHTFDDGIQDTILWYQTHQDWIESLSME